MRLGRRGVRRACGQAAGQSCQTWTQNILLIATAGLQLKALPAGMACIIRRTSVVLPCKGVLHFLHPISSHVGFIHLLPFGDAGMLRV